MSKCGPDFQSYLSPGLTKMEVKEKEAEEDFQSYLSPGLTAPEIAPFMPSLHSPRRTSLPPSGIYNNPLHI